MQPITFEQLESIVSRQIETANGDFQRSLKQATIDKMEWRFVSCRADEHINSLNGLKSFIFQLYLNRIIDQPEHDKLVEKIDKVRDALFKQSMDYRQPL
jgi:hypothetical protein